MNKLVIRKESFKKLQRTTEFEYVLVLGRHFNQIAFIETVQYSVSTLICLPSKFYRVIEPSCEKDRQLRKRLLP
ncbi:MAG: hypothetical protein OEQ28_14215, partial [Acidobacteriota bacterium]|nr:hypothetical protein [Acidobacteriota bacterium]